MADKEKPGAVGAAGFSENVAAGASTPSEIPQPGSEPQVPLSLRWETRHHWRALKGEFGCTETGAAVILAAYKVALAGGSWIAYSRARDHYEKPRRYRSRLYTFKQVRGAVDHLDARGLIFHDRARPGRFGWQSAFRATPELVERVGRLLEPMPPLILARPHETIILRDAHKREVDYSDNRTTTAMRNRLAGYNEALMTIDVPGDNVTPLRRIFNRDFRRGGRFYAAGSSWQNMEKAARQALKIDGVPVVEIDYDTIHPALLYAAAGVPFEGDAYCLDGWPRKLAKRAFNIMVNTANDNEARAAIAVLDEMAALAVPGSQEAFHRAQLLMDDIERKHDPIRHRFFNDQGAALMRIDSDIAETVMLLCLKQGVVVLPVHDSFLVREDQADYLEDAMQRAAYDVAKVCLTTSRSEAK